MNVGRRRASAIGALDADVPAEPIVRTVTPPTSAAGSLAASDRPPR
jgi:hypothetical protein